MANSWLRLWHDMPNDPKWRTIARRSGQSIGNVIAVYLHVLVNASGAAETTRNAGVTQSNAPDKDPDKDKDLKPKKHMSGSEKQPNQTPPPGEKKYPEDFEILWREYPKRSGSSGKAGALKAWQARRREGFSPETMLDAVSRYRKWCQSEGVVGTKFVRLAQTFLGPGHEFDNPWEINPGGKNYGQNLPATGESAAVRAVREERERWEREQREPDGLETLGADGRDLRESLDYEEWIQAVNALDESGGQHER